MGYRNRGADLLFDPNGIALKLMLDADAKRRPWSHVRLPRKPSDKTIEGSLVWTSWHSGDGLGRDSSVGLMRPMVAWSTVDTRNRGVALLAPYKQVLGTITHPHIIFTFNSKVWIVWDNATNYKVSRLSLDLLTIEATTDIGAIGTRVPNPAVVFDGTAYIPMGYADNAYQINAANVVAQLATVTLNPRFGYMAVARDKLYFSTSNNTIRSVASGAAVNDSANWSGVITIGDSGVPITALLVDDQVLYIGREDGLKGLDTALNLVDLMPDLAAYRDADNCRGMVAWHGGLLIPHVRGLFFYRDGTLTPVGPETLKTNNTPLRGRVFSMVQDGETVWAAMTSPYIASADLGAPGGGDTRSIMQLVAGRERTEDDPPDTGPIIWTVMQRQVYTNAGYQYPVKQMAIALSGTSVRLAWGLRETNGTAHYMELQQLDKPAGVAQYTGTEYNQYGWMVLAATDMGQPMLDKYLRSVELDLDFADSGAGQTIDVFYLRNSSTPDGTYVHLGTAGAVGRNELSFPAGTTARHIYILLVFSTLSSIVTPVLRRVALNYTDRPKKNTVYTAVARIAEGQEDAPGSWIEQYVDAVIAQLETWEDQAQQVAVIDPYGNTINVLVLDVRDEELESNDSLQDTPAHRVTVVLEKVP
jgi:hypothetical protein